MLVEEKPGKRVCVCVCQFHKQTESSKTITNAPFTTIKGNFFKKKKGVNRTSQTDANINKTDKLN